MCDNRSHDHDEAGPNIHPLKPTPEPENHCFCMTTGLCYCDKGDCSRCQCATNDACKCSGKTTKS
jgi:hypothetical protein